MPGIGICGWIINCHSLMNAVKDGEIEDIQAMITVISHEG